MCRVVPLSCLNGCSSSTIFLEVTSLPLSQEKRGRASTTTFTIPLSSCDLGIKTSDNLVVWERRTCSLILLILNPNNLYFNYPN